MNLKSQDTIELNNLPYKLCEIFHYIENDEEMLSYVYSSIKSKFKKNRETPKYFREKNMVCNKISVYFVPYIFHYKNSESKSLENYNTCKYQKNLFCKCNIAVFIFQIDNPDIIIVHITYYKDKLKKNGEQQFISSYLKRYWYGTHLIYKFIFNNDLSFSVDKAIYDLF